MTSLAPDGLSAAKRALLEQRLRTGKGARCSTAPSPHPPGVDVALSPAQEQLWAHAQLVCCGPSLAHAVSFHKDGPLDVPALERAFGDVLLRHDAWRTTFQPTSDGLPRLVVQPPVPVDLPVTDLSSYPPQEREDAAVAAVVEDARQVSDLVHGPLVRPRLVRFSAEQHRLYVSLNHLIFDGMTLNRVILPELVASYEAYASGTTPPLGEPALQYTDYAWWDRQRLEAGYYEPAVAHWRRRLAGAPPAVDLPLDHPRSKRTSARGGVVAVHLPAALIDPLRALGRRQGATLFQVFAAAFAVLLSRYSEQDDLVFATAVDMRSHPALQSVAGYCLAPLPLRVDLTGSPTFRQLLQRVRDEVLDNVAHPVPFAHLLSELRPPRQPGLNPVYSTMIVVEPSPPAGLDPSWQLRSTEVAIGDRIGQAELDLQFELDERPEGDLHGRLIYKRDLFEPATAARTVQHWQELLCSIVAEPDVPVERLRVLPEPERRMLGDWNRTDADFPRDATVVDLVEATVRRQPDRVAVACAGEQLTYRELNQRANRLAHRLLAAAGEPSGLDGRVVAVCTERSLDQLVALLAVNKAGAAYLPLDPSYPRERLRFMARDAAPVLVVGHRHLLNSLDLPDLPQVPLDEDADEAVPAAPLPVRPHADSWMYVLYTSGSTGQPRGVAVTHRSVVNLLCAVRREPGLEADDRLLAVATASFDIAAVELWLPLVVGARIELATSDDAADGRRLRRLLEACAASYLQATPGTWTMLLDAGWDGDPRLVAVCTGEPLPPELAARLLPRVGALWNGYGPTETTVWSTMERVTRADDITIGRPLPNTQLYVLNAADEPVPIGVPGELHIAGAGVAVGYVNRPESTAERFRPNPFGSGRLYRTGDRVRWRADGRLEHLGRLDHQLKVRGFRVEPAEVEAVLGEHPDVAAAVVVGRPDSSGGQRLVGYLVPAASASPDVDDLRKLLRRRLPSFLVPSELVVVDELPRLPNGKLDRAALPEPGRAAAGQSVEPSTPLERQLAEIWRRLLPVERLGVDDDFFDLGGHSLLAVRMLTCVGQHVGVDVPLAALLEYGPTVRGLARAIAAAKGEARRDETSADDDRPLLFFIGPHPFVGARHFVRGLADDLRVVTYFPKLEERKFVARSVTEIAEEMLLAIRARQPVGPYLLVGYSMGGLVAYEIARLLQDSGEEVDYLGMLDAGPAAGARRYFSARGRLRRLAGYQSREVLPKLAQRVRYHLARRNESELAPFDLTDIVRLVRAHVDRPIDVPMHVYLTPKSIRSVDETAGWSEVHGGPLMLRKLGVEHVTLMHEPDVHELVALVADDVRETLRRRRSLAPAGS